MAYPTPSHANPAAVRIQRFPPQRRPSPFSNARLITITRINHSVNSAGTYSHVQPRRRPAPFSMAFYDGEVMIIDARPVSPSPNSAATYGHAQSRRRPAPFSAAFYEGEVMIIDARPVSSATEETAAAPTVVHGLSKIEISRFLETSIYEKGEEEAAAGGGGGDPELCAICQEIYREKQRLGVLRCRHRFHAQCIGEWLEIKNVCPLCNAVGAVVRNQDY